MTLLLLSGCATQSAEKTYRQITMEEAITMMEEETGYIILDVRTAQEYSEKHIPGAISNMRIVVSPMFSDSNYLLLDTLFERI